MIALDTNLLAHLLLKDDAAQHVCAKVILATDRVFTAAVTVFLELVWVLEANDCPAADMSRGLELLLGLPNFRSAQADALHQALHGYARGMDFSDARHLALSQGDEALMTLDRAFARKAPKLVLAPPVTTSQVGVREPTKPGGPIRHDTGDGSAVSLKEQRTFAHSGGILLMPPGSLLRHPVQV
jgi:predicted nucleic-acid-binding protein